MAQEATESKPAEAAEPPPSVAELRGRLRGKWQIPLLALSVACFALALAVLAISLQHAQPTAQSLLNDAESALAQQDYRKADRFCDEFQKLYPGRAGARRIAEVQGDANVGLASVSYEGEQAYLKKACTAYRAAADVQAEELPSPRILLKLGRVHLRLGEAANALNCLDQALRNAPADPLEVHLAKVEALRALEPKPDLDAALAEIKTVRSELPDLSADQKAEVALVEAQILNERGEHSLAERKLRALVEAEPQSATSKKFLLALAETQWLADRPTLALDTLQRVVSMPADKEEETSGRYAGSEALLTSARIYFDMTNYERALETFRRTAAEYPGSDESLAAQVGTAETYLVLGELKSASEVYAQVAPELRKLRPGQNRFVNLNAVRHVLKVQGEAAVLARRHDEARQLVMLEESVMRSPDRDVLLRHAAILCRVAETAAAVAEGGGAGSPKRLAAEQAWREAARLFLQVAETFDGSSHKEYPDDLWQAGRCYVLAGAHEEAVATLSRLVKDQPNDSRVPQARVELARQLEVLGRWDDAIEVLQDVVKRHGSTLPGFEATYLVGTALIRKGDAAYDQKEKSEKFYDEAEEVFRGLLESSDKVNPRSLWYQKSLLEMGRLLHRRGQYDRAILRLNEYVQRYGDDPDALSARYLLASSIHHQGICARVAIGGETSPTQKEALREIWRQKLQAAAAAFDELLPSYERLSPQELTPLREQEYRNVLFEQAESLKELGERDEAVRIYNLIIYRFQGLPCVMPAYVGLAGIYQGDGRADELEALLERARWTLEKIPEEAFREKIGSPSKLYWENWLRAMRRSS